MKLKYGVSQKCPQDSAIQLLKKKYENAQKFLKNLFSFQIPNRQKRGLINGLGEFHKFLYGTLANSDMQYINGHIETLYNRTDKAILLEANHTRITQDSIKIISDDFETLNTDLKNISDYLDLVQSNINILKVSNYIQNAMLEIEMALADYKSMIESLITGITFSHSGHVPPNFMPPNVLVTSLQELQKADKYNTPTFEISREKMVHA